MHVARQPARNFKASSNVVLTTKQAHTQIMKNRNSRGILHTQITKNRNSRGASERRNNHVTQQEMDSLSATFSANPRSPTRGSMSLWPKPSSASVALQPEQICSISYAHSDIKRTIRRIYATMRCKQTIKTCTHIQHGLHTPPKDLAAP